MGKPVTFLTISVLLISTLLLSFPYQTGASQTNNWTITDTQVVENQTIILDGNLTIKTGASLTLKGVTLQFDCQYNGQYGLLAESGSSLYIQNSTICNTQSQNAFSFVVASDRFEMNQSQVYGCGWGTPSAFLVTALSTAGLQQMGLYVSTNNAKIENNTLHDNFVGVLLVGNQIQFTNNSVYKSKLDCVDTFGNYCTISGNNISEPSTGGKEGCLLFLYNNNGTSVSNNTLHNSPFYGLMLSHAWYSAISNNTIYLTISDTMYSYPGLFLISLSCNNQIINNTIFNCTDPTIHLSNSCSNNLIESNRFEDLEFDSSDGNTVNNNTVTTGPITFCNSSHNLIVNNNIESFNAVKIYLSSKENTITSNRFIGTDPNIGGHTDTGISIYYASCSGNQIIGNDFYYSGVRIFSAGNNTIQRNNFNGYCQVTDDAGIFWNRNYWSTYTGTDTNGDGIGDTPYVIPDKGFDYYPRVNRNNVSPYIVPAFSNITYESYTQDKIWITQNTVIENTTLHIPDSGLYVTWDCNLTIKNSNLIMDGKINPNIWAFNNSILKIVNCSISGKGYGIFTEPNSTFELVNSTISNCGLATGDPMAIQTNKAIVVNNTIIGSMGGMTIGDSLHTLGSVNPYVFNNTVEDSYSGIAIETSNCTLSNNHVIRVMNNGIFVNGDNNTVANNTLSWCGNSVNVYGKNNTLIGNTMSNVVNGYDIMLQDSTNIIKNNNFLNFGGILSSGSTVSNNFYNDYSGADLNGDGIGDTPYNNWRGYDQSPLVYPVIWDYSNPIPVLVNGTEYFVGLTSNSTITSFAFNKAQNQISINCTGSSSPANFFNITIPKGLLNASQWIVNVNGVSSNTSSILLDQLNNGIFFTYSPKPSNAISIQAIVPPSPTPTATPTPTPTPTSTPTTTPSPTPVPTPTPTPTATPTPTPTASPSPSPSPSTSPTTNPTQVPTSSPTNNPTTQPTPSSNPTTQPTTSPTLNPTTQPTTHPTTQPTQNPTPKRTPTTTPTNTATSTPMPTPTVPEFTAILLLPMLALILFSAIAVKLKKNANTKLS